MIDCFIWETFDEHWLFAGAQIAPRLGDENWTPPAGDKPLVYTSLGTLFNNWPEYFRMLGQAVRGLPLQLEAVIGSNIKPSDLGELPPNMKVAEFLPQLPILQRTSLFLTHAGTGSVMEGIYYGVPMFAIPQMDEQVITAARMVELGLGDMIADKSKVSAELLREKITALLASNSHAATMKTFQAKMQASGGAALAAERTIAYLKGK